jgi:hypothetical protein
MPDLPYVVIEAFGEYQEDIQRVHETISGLDGIEIKYLTDIKHVVTDKLPWSLMSHFEGKYAHEHAAILISAVRESWVNKGKVSIARRD